MEKKVLIGYTTGVFDMFHVGHLNLLKNAKSLCDYLIVGVSTDQLCIENKGIIPIVNENDRYLILESIRYVDKVVFQSSYNKIEAHDDLKFDIMFVGDDWKGTSRWNKLESDFKKRGVEIIYFEYSKNISSTILREKIKHL